MHFLPPIGQWQALKQIECFCNVNEVDVPVGVKLAIEQHEIAAKRSGAFLDGWDTVEFLSAQKNTGAADGNCMFYHKKLKIKRGAAVKNIECIEGRPNSKIVNQKSQINLWQ